MHRRMAESFGVDPARYDRTRPSYPDVLVRRIVAAAPGPMMLNVGCGTGIEARQFQAAGCTVLGVEPDARMARFAEDRGLPVEISKFEEWDAAGRLYDAVVAGTAWHWVHPTAGVAKAAQVLRPGGVLVPFGHASELPAAVSDAFTETLRQVFPDAPFPTQSAVSPLDGYQALYEKVADGIRASGDFAEPLVTRDDWEHEYTKEQWLDQLPTSGVLTTLEPARLDQVLAVVGDAIDAVGGRFVARYATVAVLAKRLP